MAFGHPASRKQTYALIGLTGHSGTGKTYSALRLATGLAGDGLIALIDTENGRGSMYAPKFRYNVEPLYPPFTPKRYADLVLQAEAEGVKVLIIDSFSHEWESIGGVLEMAENSKGLGFQKWNGPKLAHKKMLNAILQSRMHVIICMRGKDEQIEALNPKNNKVEWMKTGVVIPIQEQRVDYEMTVSLILGAQGFHCRLGKNCPEELRGMFDGQVMSEQIGKDFGVWLNEGVVETKEERWLRLAKEEAGYGTASFKEHWKRQSVEAQSYLKKFSKELATIRDAADEAQDVDTTEQPDAEPVGAGVREPGMEG